MKLYQTRYDEAAERNVRRMNRAKYNACKEGYNEKVYSLESMKHALGIKQSDTKYDSKLKELLA
jgi:hypothetical protein